MANDGNKIWAPVSVEDVRKVLGESSYDVATLCMSEQINPYSLVRPAYTNLYDLMTDSFKEGLTEAPIALPNTASYDLMNYGYWVPRTSGTQNIQRISQVQWIRYKPTSTSWKNLEHFNGYIHDAVPKIGIERLTVIKGQSGLVGLQMTIGREGDGTGPVNIPDIFGSNIAKKLNKKFYLGVLVLHKAIGATDSAFTILGEGITLNPIAINEGDGGYLMQIGPTNIAGNQVIRAIAFIADNTDVNASSTNLYGLCYTEGFQPWLEQTTEATNVMFANAKADYKSSTTRVDFTIVVRVSGLATNNKIRIGDLSCTVSYRANNNSPITTVENIPVYWNGTTVTEYDNGDTTIRLYALTSNRFPQAALLNPSGMSQLFIKATATIPGESTRTITTTNMAELSPVNPGT